jgi:polyhydroxybutyrate depolymerase
MRHDRGVRALVLVSLLAAGCVQHLDRCEEGAPGERLSCPVPGWTDRAFDIEIPPSWDRRSALPLVIVFHGGGGRRESAERVTCPDGDLDSDGCLPATAAARGFVTVLPDGTGSRPFRNIRTWNGGGGVGDWQCTSGGACKADVDDMAYFDDLMQEVRRIVPIGDIFATGLSNGGAVTHRLACERAEQISAIATFGGENQFAAAGGLCDLSVPVLAIHGTDDPCWAFETGAGACLQDDGKQKVGAMESTQEWAHRDGCGLAPPVEAPLPDVDPDDGTTATRVRWDGCIADVALLRIDGGGHTWPGGWQYLDESEIGRVSHDVDGNQEILDFFDAHRRF